MSLIVTSLLAWRAVPERRRCAGGGSVCGSRSAPRAGGGETCGACCSAEPKPQRLATSSRPSAASSSRRRAASSARTLDELRRRHAGLAPEDAREVARAHRRARRRAARPTGRRRGWRRSTAGRSRSGPGGVACAARWLLNCDCPPGRLRNTTSRRATASATAWPRSSSTSASARSMPAVTPAEV